MEEDHSLLEEVFIRGQFVFFLRFVYTTVYCLVKFSSFILEWSFHAVNCSGQYCFKLPLRLILFVLNRSTIDIVWITLQSILFWIALQLLQDTDAISTITDFREKCANQTKYGSQLLDIGALTSYCSCLSSVWPLSNSWIREMTLFTDHKKQPQKIHFKVFTSLRH